MLSALYFIVPSLFVVSFLSFTVNTTPDIGFSSSLPSTYSCETLLNFKLYSPSICGLSTPTVISCVSLFSETLILVNLSSFTVGTFSKITLLKLPLLLL